MADTKKTVKLVTSQLKDNKVCVLDPSKSPDLSPIENLDIWTPNLFHQFSWGEWDTVPANHLEKPVEENLTLTQVGSVKGNATKY